MTASSQTPWPPEAAHTIDVPDAVRATYAGYGVHLPCSGGSPAPRAPQASADAQDPARVTTLQAATAVLSAQMQSDDGSTNAGELAAAEERAGLLFDAGHVQAAVDAALEQARTEYAAELTETRRQLAVMSPAHRHMRAVLRLCEGRRGDDLLLVSAVARAAGHGTTALDGLPMTLTWDRSAEIPAAADPVKRVTVHCVSPYGGRAALVVEGVDRLALASQLDAEVIRDIHAACPTHGCGAVDEWDASDPVVFGWVRLEVAGIEGGPRWYCSPPCVSAALARAGEDLAAADQAAAVDPVDQAAWLDARYGPGASDEYALQAAEAAEAGFEDMRGDDGDGVL